MPTLFLAHGSPTNAVVENEFTQTLSKLGAKLPRPKAILMVSAHWEANGSFVTGMENPRTIYDFNGFPKELYEVQYPARGNPILAQYIASKLSASKVGIDDKWGLDHGTWSVLKHLYPKADIPVLQLSLDRTKPLAFHLEFGRQLKFLRREGVMIMGSGNIVHNLREIDWKETAPPYDWAIQFDEWTKEKILARDRIAFVDKVLDSKEGQLSIPTLEHYLPLLYILGASDDEDSVTFDYEGFQNASMSMRCVSILLIINIR